MAGNTNFIWNVDELRGNVRSLPRKITRLIVATIEYHASRGEATMRRTAKWKDRTTNARNGLHTSTQHTNTFTGSRHTIAFAHSVPYGIWLEIRWSGRYAVIMPSVLTTGPQVLQTLNKGMMRLS